MKKQKLKFKKLMNEYRAESYELKYVEEVLKDANADFEEYYQQFCIKKRVQLGALKKKHANRLQQIFASPPALRNSVEKKLQQQEYDSKNLFRQIARKFHPDTIPLDDPRQDDYAEVFKKAANAIQEAKWGELFDIAETHNLDLDEYDTVIKSLKADIQRVQSQIKKKKGTYAWLLYECETDQEKDEIIKRFLNHIYVDYQDTT